MVAPNLDSDDDVQVFLHGTTVALLVDDERRSGRLGAVVRNMGSEPFAVTDLAWVNAERLDIELHAILDENRQVGSTQATDLDINEAPEVVHPPELPYTVEPTGGGETPAELGGTPWMGTEFVFRYEAPASAEPYAYADLLQVTVEFADGTERTAVADTALVICDDEAYADQSECENDAFGQEWSFADA